MVSLLLNNQFSCPTTQESAVYSRHINRTSEVTSDLNVYVIISQVALKTLNQTQSSSRLFQVVEYMRLSVNVAEWIRSRAVMLHCTTNLMDPVQTPPCARSTKTSNLQRWVNW
jgi:hypothetical protein